MPTMAEVAQEQMNNPDNWMLSQDQKAGLQAPAPAAGETDASLQQAFGPGALPAMGGPGQPPVQQPTVAQQTGADTEPPAGPMQMPADHIQARPNDSPLTPRQALVASGNVDRSDRDILAQQSANVSKVQAILQQGGVDKAAAEAERKRQDDALALAREMRSDVASTDAKNAEVRRAQMAAEQRDRHVDPQKWFKDRGTAGQILAAISIGAGAFAAAMPHSGNNTNQALGIINGAVDRDVDAQKSEIEKGWKNLDYQGAEDEKSYVHDQRELAQMDAHRLTAYDHATALISGIQAKTADAAKVQSLEDVKSGIAQQQNQIRKNQVSQREAVGEREAAKQAAVIAAAKKKWEADPRNPDNVRKDWTSLVNDTQKQNAAHPDKIAGIPTFDEFLRQRITGGTERDLSEAPGSKKQADAAEKAKDEKVNKAVEAYGDLGRKAAGSATVANAALSYLPRWLAPGANMAADDVNQYNDTVLPQVLKSLESRMTSEQIDQQRAALTIHPGMPKDQKDARIQALQRIASTTQAFKNAKGDAPESSVIPGATLANP